MPELLSIQQIADVLEVDYQAAQKRLWRAGFEPTKTMGRNNLYDPSVIASLQAWEAGKPGVLPPWMCDVYPVREYSKGPGVPCLYQRGHTGRHHFELHELTPLLQPKPNRPDPASFLRSKLEQWDVTLPAELSPGVPLLELFSTWMQEWGRLAKDADYCPDDPDGEHFVGCGCPQ